MGALGDLDVQQDLKATIDTLLESARSVNAEVSAQGGRLSEPGRQTLDLISKKIAEAEDYYARALDSKELYGVLASVHRAIGDGQGAGRFERQGRLFEANELEFQGRIEAFYGNTTRALEHFNAALKLIPDHDYALKGAAAAAKRIERSRSTLQKLKESAQLKKGAKEWIALGQAYADLGQLKEALAAFETAATADPGGAEAVARQGTTVHAMGRAEEALALYRRALELKPSALIAKRGVNYATFQLERR